MKKIIQVTIAILNAITGMATVCGGFWVSGFNFTERGPTAVTCYVFSVAVGFTLFCATMGGFALDAIHEKKD